MLRLLGTFPIKARIERKEARCHDFKPFVQSIFIIASTLLYRPSSSCFLGGVVGKLPHFFAHSFGLW
jgi:hypothetical protein